MESIIKIQNLHYKVDEKFLLRDISLDIHAGETFAILGSNGAGKSTLIDQITGDLSPSSGSLEYPKHQNLKTFKNNLGIVYDSTPFYPMLKVKEILNLFGRIYGIRYKDRMDLIEQLQLKEIMNRLFSKLSKGERKKVGLFIAFCHEPAVIMLDEPTGELDPLMRDKLWKSVFKKQENRCLIFSTHHWEEAYKYADRIAFISKGMLVGDILSKSDIAAKIDGKKVIISKQAIDPQADSRIAETQFSQDEANYYFYPEQQHEKDFINLITQHTLNFSIEEKSLEDYYKAHI